ncbi:MAG: exodeoxyribonuclease VII small subunit [Lachnospiraceae bacterium]|nr:exodeoxyribonuclease VII small subunit [Lachnospiraceae bacterium]
MKIEEQFKEIDNIINSLEMNEGTLDESFELYKKGMDLIKECNNEIEKVEKQIIVLTESE